MPRGIRMLRDTVYFPSLSISFFHNNSDDHKINHLNVSPVCLVLMFHHLTFNP